MKFILLISICALMPAARAAESCGDQLSFAQKLTVHLRSRESSNVRLFTKTINGRLKTVVLDGLDKFSPDAPYLQASLSGKAFPDRGVVFRSRSDFENVVFRAKRIYDEIDHRISAYFGLLKLGIRASRMGRAGAVPFRPEEFLEKYYLGYATSGGDARAALDSELVKSLKANMPITIALGHQRANVHPSELIEYVETRVAGRGLFEGLRTKPITILDLESGAPRSWKSRFRLAQVTAMPLLAWAFGAWHSSYGQNQTVVAALPILLAEAYELARIVLDTLPVDSVIRKHWSTRYLFYSLGVREGDRNRAAVAKVDDILSRADSDQMLIYTRPDRFDRLRDTFLNNGYSEFTGSPGDLVQDNRDENIWEAVDRVGRASSETPKG